MSLPSGTRSFFRKDRLFVPLMTFLVAFDAIAIATECMKTGVLDRTPAHGRIQAAQFKLQIKFPMLRFTDAMVRNIEPGGFQLIFLPDSPVIGNQIGPTMFGYVPVTMRIMTGVFLQFYESHAGALRHKFTKDKNTWPPLFYFARMIRHFVAHTNGKVRFDDARAPAMRWYHFTYSPADKGKVAVGPNELYIGELILLMIELSDELDRLGFSVPGQGGT